VGAVLFNGSDTLVQTHLHPLVVEDAEGGFGAHDGLVAAYWRLVQPQHGLVCVDGGPQRGHAQRPAVAHKRT
jgi:hypothetical protein